MRLNLEDVHIDDGWAKIYGKGSKEAIVPLGERLAIHLHKYLYEVRPNIVKNSQEKAFFVSNRGTRYSKSGLSMLVRRYLKKVGVKGKIGPHKLRHTFATNYLRYEGNLEALRRVMRHSNLQTTQRYLGLLTEDIRNDHRKASPIDNLMKIRNE
jgi:integrase/recombinase XerD